MRREEIENLLDPFITELKYNEKSDKTLIHYKHVVSMFIKQVKNEIVTKEDVMSFKAMLINSYKPKTVTNYITILNKFLKHVEIEGLIVKNIKVQQKASLEEVLEPIDLKRLLRMAKKLEQMDMYYIMKIIAFTGVRAEELKIFTVENLRSNYIQVNNKGKIRNVILRQDLRRELLRYCKDEKIETGFIFKGKKENTMLHQTTVWKRLKLIAGKCRGVKKSKVHAHSFRHLFAIQFIGEGGDISELADILGHSSIETTRIYTRTTDSMKRKRMERMKY